MKNKKAIIYIVVFMVFLILIGIFVMYMKTPNSDDNYVQDFKIKYLEYQVSNGYTGTGGKYVINVGKNITATKYIMSSETSYKYKKQESQIWDDTKYTALENELYSLGLDSWEKKQQELDSKPYEDLYAITDANTYRLKILFTDGTDLHLSAYGNAFFNIERVLNKYF